MRLLFYAPVKEGPGERLQKVIEEFVPKNKVNVEVYRNIENLSRRLRQPANDLPIAVLLAARREDLTDILSVRHLLCDVRIILILPDREENTISQGHILRPRFMSYTDSDFADVFAVLGKCLESYAPKL
jgi:hypothetical protein